MDNEALENSDILQENSRILQRLQENGLKIQKKAEFEFTVSLPEKEDCKKVRQVFRDKYKVPEGGMFIVVDDPKDYQLVLSVEIRPTAEAITKIEVQLLEAAKNFKTAEVYWEFRE